MVKVSVVVATYNQPELLPLALNSLIDQTFKDMEIIVVPVFSDEKTLALLEKYRGTIETEVSKEADYIHQRNIGIQKAKGTFITFFDSDDFAFPYKIQQEHDVATAQNAMLVYSTYVRADMDLVPIVAGVMNQSFILDVPIFPTASYQLLLQSCYIYDYSLVHESMYREFGILDETLKQAAKYDKWLHIMEKYASKVAFNPHPTFLYRTYPEQMHLTEQQKPEHASLMDQVRRASLSRYQQKQKQWLTA